MFLDDFNIESTLLGGQSFLWLKNDECFYAFHSDFVLKLFREKGKIRVEQLWGKEISIENYFQLDYCLKVKANLLNSGDKFIKQALNLGNIFVLAQPFYDTLFSFIASSNNNIKRIRKINFNLAQRFGETVKIEGKILHLYPRLDILAELKEGDLTELGYGFRAKYLIKSAQIILCTKKSIMSLNELLQLPGVGNKIADCVLVFSGSEHSFSPVDVWMARILKKLYGFESKKYSDYRNFFKRKWGNSSALVAQYLFEYYRQKAQFF